MSIKKSKHLIDAAVKTLYGFQTGTIPLIPTKISHLDEKLNGGFKPADVLGIVGRSGHGKTHLLERIERELIKQDILLVRAAWELEPLKLLIRRLAHELDVPASEIIKTVPQDEMLVKYKQICQEERSENILYQDEPVSPQVFEQDLEWIVETFPDKKICFTLDNLENVLNSGDQKKTMDDIIYIINVYKKKHPFLFFIIINQMNREILGRSSDPRQHAPRPSDIYGSGALFKICDVIIASHIPYMLGIDDKYMVFSKYKYDYLLDHKISSSPSAKTASFDPYGRVFYHYLKDRNLADLTRDNDIFIEQFRERPDEWPSNEIGGDGEEEEFDFDF